MLRRVELPRSSVPALLAQLLYQLGYAVLPPRQPDKVSEVLDQIGQRREAQGLYDAGDLEPWQPCLVSLRVSVRARDEARRGAPDFQAEGSHVGPLPAPGLGSCQSDDQRPPPW